MCHDDDDDDYYYNYIQGVKPTTPPESSTEVKNAWSFTTITPMRLHGMLLN
jgi:hypothetical protein